jgi:hypothetical protein
VPDFVIDVTRDILVGELKRIRDEPITSRIRTNLGGTIREFFHYAFPRNSTSGPTPTKGRPRFSTMKQLAIVLPVRVVAEAELPVVYEGIQRRIKTEKGLNGQVKISVSPNVES